MSLTVQKQRLTRYGMEDVQARVALKRAIQIAGGPKALSRVIGISSQAISQWDRAPVNRVLAIEAAVSKAVRREELRPDIYPPEAA